MHTYHRRGLWALGLLVVALLSPTLGRAEEIPVVKQGGVFHVPVEVNGVITLRFMLDTGASEVNIPADVMLTLYRTGTITDADFLPGQTYRLADGSTVKSARFRLKSLKIGRRTIPHVVASIGPLASPLLLGQSFLEQLGPWGLDGQRQVLTLGPSGRAPPKRGKASPGPSMTVENAPQTPAAPRTLRHSLGMAFVLIPAGTFQMGADDGGNDEQPVHTVRISRPFYLGTYEVTQGQWEAVMGDNPSRFTGDATRPVERVSWNAVQASSAD